MVDYSRLDTMATSILVADLRCFINISEFAQTVYKNIHYPHRTTNFQPAYHKYQPHKAKRLAFLCSLGLRAVSRVIFAEHGVLRTNK